MTRLRATALAATLASTAFAMPASALEEITFQLDWLPGGDKAPIYVCIEQGICEEAGFDVTVSPGRGSSEAITKLATGVAEFGSAGMGAVMAARAMENVPVTAIMSIFNTGPHAFYTTKDTGIASIADVKGHSIATSPFTSSNVFLPLVLADNGMTEDDITLTKADPGALGPLLMTGQSDVIIAWLTDVTRYSNQASEAGKEIVYLPWADAGLELYSASLVGNDDYMAANPELTKAFVAAFKASLEFAYENPQIAAEAVAAQVPELTAEDVMGSWMDASKLAFNEVTDEFGLGAFDADRVAATWDRVAASQGLDAADLDPETAVSRDYLPE
ncbi:ABC transporter substrate-binding protein [Pseudooceanicola algae]|uniref:Riboflavin-binding protein RibY n=1 Tax=Pseudooceanicola algae TaxID=1537215 RepID=A0A418SJT0_9RHOB|nr:ABC transporter substrate-binding protein [Pseudooceanicola algae]QPM88820.1 Riboflavin-binding protein RibY [Pseudooceanicola algae]